MSRRGDTSEFLQTIQEMRISSNGRVLTDQREIKIAFYLMNCGSWEVRENSVGGDERIDRFEWIAEPFIPEGETVDQGFHVGGSLSSMASKSFLETARGSLEPDDGRPLRLRTLAPAVDPETLAVAIPQNYR